MKQLKDMQRREQMKYKDLKEPCKSCLRMHPTLKILTLKEIKTANGNQKQKIV